MSLVITGASGQLGRRTAELLLERVDRANVILVSRTPAELDDFAVRGVTVRHGDFDEPHSLPGAFAGGRRMLLVSTNAVGSRVAQHRRAIAAAAAAGVVHVGYTSVPNPGEHNPAVAAREHHETEQALRESGLAWTFLRNSLYGEFEVGSAASAGASGMFVTNRGHGAVAFVSREDCAAAAAGWLAGVPASEGQAYDITGPALVTPTDEAALFSALTGAPVEVIHVDDETFAGRVAALSGVPIELARTRATFGRAIREGHLAVLSGAVEQLAGRPPRALREVLGASTPTRA